MKLGELIFGKKLIFGNLMYITETLCMLLQCQQKNKAAKNHDVNNERK